MTDKNTDSKIIFATLCLVFITFISLNIDLLGGSSLAQTISGTTNFSTTTTSGGATSTYSTSYPDTISPTVPVNLSASDITSSGFKLQWNNSFDPYVAGQLSSGVSGYNIFINNNTTPFTFSSGNSFVFTNIPSGITNRFTVVAVDNAGNNSGQSAPLYVTTSTTNTTTQYSTTTIYKTSTSTTSAISPSPSLSTTTQLATAKELFISPPNTITQTGRYVFFRAVSFSGLPVSPVSWSVLEANGGTINNNGEYMAPYTAGTYHIVAKSPGYIDKRAFINVIIASNAQPNLTNTTSGNLPPMTTDQKVVISNPYSTNAPVASIANFSTTTRPVLVQASPQQHTVIATQQIQNLNSSISTINITIDENRQKLIDVIDKRIAEVTSVNNLGGNATSTANLMAIKDKIINEYDATLIGTTTVASSTIKNLSSRVEQGLDSISVVGEFPKQNAEASSTELASIFGSLDQKLTLETQNVKKLGGDLMLKDSNKDGISDYDSITLYNMDPVASSPITDFGGKKINAEEKVKLGFDPTAKELVTVFPEEPKISTVAPTSVYKVKDVRLTQNKKVYIKGQSLPNSLVTIYIYSTPIIVTVKANDNGVWEYTLDKEIDTGEHKIYTASVNNSGKIIAKSPEYSFVKTAEAATLKDLTTFSLQQKADVVTKPGILDNWNIYIVIILFIGILFVSIGLLSFGNKNKD